MNSPRLIQLHHDVDASAEAAAGLEKQLTRVKPDEVQVDARLGEVAKAIGPLFKLLEEHESPPPAAGRACTLPPDEASALLNQIAQLLAASDTRALSLAQDHATDLATLLAEHWSPFYKFIEAFEFEESMHILEIVRRHLKDSE